MSQWVVLTTIMAELNYQIKKRQICEFKYSKFSQGCKTSNILLIEGLEPIPGSYGTNFNDTKKLSFKRRAKKHNTVRNLFYKIGITLKSAKCV